MHHVEIIITYDIYEVIQRISEYSHHIYSESLC